MNSTRTKPLYLDRVLLGMDLSDHTQNTVVPKNSVLPENKNSQSYETITSTLDNLVNEIVENDKIIPLYNPGHDKSSFLSLSSLPMDFGRYEIIGRAVALAPLNMISKFDLHPAKSGNKFAYSTDIMNAGIKAMREIRWQNMDANHDERRRLERYPDEFDVPVKYSDHDPRIPEETKWALGWQNMILSVSDDFLSNKIFTHLAPLNKVLRQEVGKGNIKAVEVDKKKTNRKSLMYKANDVRERSRQLSEKLYKELGRIYKV